MKLMCILGRKASSNWLETSSGRLLPIYDTIYPEYVWAYMLLEKDGLYYYIMNYLSADG